MGSTDEEEVKKLSCCERCTIRWNDFKKSAWNKETRQCFGKSPSDWGKSFLSYSLFYGIFAAFYVICFAVLAATLDDDRPWLISMRSPLQNNPAMGFEPKTGKDSTLIKLSNSTSNSVYLDKLGTIYDGYLNSSESRDCSFESPNKNDGKPCRVNVSTLGEKCTPEKNFGYSDYEPCVLLTINRVIGWDPLQNDFSKLNCLTTGNNTPICKSFNAIPRALKTKVTPGYIPISCQGQNDGDKDNIVQVDFYPKEGVPTYFYPYSNQPGFKSPAIMAKFRVVPGTLVMVWCKLWTSNIKHDMADQQGSVKFEMLVDSPTNFSDFFRNSTLT